MPRRPFCPLSENSAEITLMTTLI